MAKYIITVNKNLSHAGIKGMKWGRRRFQNEDGSLTEAGRKRYGVGGGDSDGNNTSSSSAAKAGKQAEKEYKKKAREQIERDARVANIEARMQYAKEHPYDADGIDKAGKQAEKEYKKNAQEKINQEARVSNIEARVKYKDNKPGTEPSVKTEAQTPKNTNSEQKKSTPDVNLKDVKSLADNSAKLATASAKGIRSIPVNVERMDLKGMSNKDMQDRINREILERQYDSMFNTKRARVERGRNAVADIVDGVGTVVTISSAAIGVAAAIKTLKS